jgi:hypothetical protein
MAMMTHRAAMAPNTTMNNIRSSIPNMVVLYKHTRLLATPEPFCQQPIVFYHAGT